jgi:hypothetical protein
MSEDKARSGGDLGWFARGAMRYCCASLLSLNLFSPLTLLAHRPSGDFEKVAFATPVGSFSQPFKTAHGYHIVLVEGRK